MLLNTSNDLIIHMGRHIAWPRHCRRYNCMRSCPSQNLHQICFGGGTTLVATAYLHHSVATRIYHRLRISWVQFGHGDCPFSGHQSLNLVLALKAQLHDNALPNDLHRGQSLDRNATCIDADNTDGSSIESDRVTNKFSVPGIPRLQIMLQARTPKQMQKLSNR